MKRAWSRSLAVVFLACLLGLSAGRHAWSQSDPPTRVEVYPAPPGITLSPQYTVQIVQAGQSQNSPVYQTQNPAFLPDGQPSGVSTSSTREQTTAWTSFSTDGPVVVQITNSQPFQSVRILPSHAHIAPVVTGTVVSFAMSDTGQQQVAVDFCAASATCDDSTDTDVTHPLLVFANPLPGPPPAGALIAVPGGAIPPLAGQSGIYFGPGLYDLGPTPYVLGSNQTAFLAGGAYVKGLFSIAPGATGTMIEGRGILSGEEVQQSSCPPPRNLCPAMIGGSGVLGDVAIEGITIVNAPFYNILLGGNHNAARDIKVLSWLGNTDGVSVAGSPDPDGSSIRDSFFKTGDDAIKLFSSNLLVDRCTVWQMNNAAPFEMGVNLSLEQSNVVVENSDVIRTEWTYPTRSNAVVSAALGGNANVGDYVFRHIRIENSDFQLFKIALIPNQYTTPGNDSLGSITGLTFSDIQVTDPQAVPSLFQSFDLLHRIRDVRFDGVSLAGQAVPQPIPSFNANRNLSLGGTVFSSLLWRRATQSRQFQLALFSGAADGLPSSTVDATNDALTKAFRIEGVADVDGDGYASVLVRDQANGELGFWQRPLFPGTGEWNSRHFPIERIDDGVLQVGRDYQIGGVGDFNGDGHSDILLWNTRRQIGEVLLMRGPRMVGHLTVQPATASSWRVAGIGDINQTGYSDIVLRDAQGNVELLLFGPGGLAGSTDLTPSNFFFTSTADYNAQWPGMSGHFDATWTVAGIADFVGDGYAGILWRDGVGDLGLTSFAPATPTVLSGQVFARLPSGQDQIAGLGDFNGDDTTDVLIRNPQTGALTVWYAGYYGGAHYEAGPTLPAPPGYVLQ